MAVYGISDTHFGHKNILKYREGFGSIEEHDEIIRDNILSVVRKRDSLYILGDVCVYDTSWHIVKDIANRVSFLHICLGNHDIERKNCPSLDDYMSVCKSVFGMKKYKNFWLTHAPIHPDELRGQRNCHGHVHYNTLNDDRYVNISCEAIDYTPVDLSKI